ncbi:MAG: nucleotidyltransferase domain-containing protein [Caldisericia bacterium]|nr:nucleotidyltransferase domain-containing protein [Caldisericia bacterium]
MKSRQNEIKEVIYHVFDFYHIKVTKVLLFGSRSRGQFSDDSDWDFLIIVEKSLTRNEKIDISYQIKEDLAKKHIPCDIIIRSRSEIGNYTSMVHSVTKTALEEGILF